MSIQVPPQYSPIRWLMIAIAVGLVSLFLWQIRSILLYGLSAIMLVILITIPVGQLNRIGIRRTPAILITFLGIIILMILLVMLVLPTLVSQFVILGEEITKGLREMVDYWNSGTLREDFPFLSEIEFIDFKNSQIDVETVRNFANQILATLSQVSGSVIPFIGGIANTILSLLIVFFLTMFFLVNPQMYKDGFVQLFPLWYRQRVHQILDRLNTLLRRWIFAQLIGMMVTGLGTFIGLSLVGIQQATALAVMTAVFSFVPTFGELISVSVALAVAAVQAPDSLAWVVIIIYGVSFLQGQLIGPLIASESVNVPPVLILLGQIVVARFFGVLGIVLAVPILVIVMVLIQEVYIKDILGDTINVKNTTGVKDTKSVETPETEAIEPYQDGLLSDGV